MKIEASRLGKRFSDGRPALEDLSFTVASGESAAILGPNGSGKTTALFRCTDLTTGTGHCHFDGQRFRDLSAPALQVGLSFGPGTLTLSRTVRDHFRIAAMAAGLDRRAAEQSLELCGLGHVADRRLSALSSGFRQRCAIGLALVAQPRVVMLDEPEANLDQEGVAWLGALLTDLRRGGTTVLVACHDTLTRRVDFNVVVELSAGRVVAAL